MPSSGRPPRFCLRQLCCAWLAPVCCWRVLHGCQQPELAAGVMEARSMCNTRALQGFAGPLVPASACCVYADAGPLACPRRTADRQAPPPAQQAHACVRKLQLLLHLARLFLVAPAQRPVSTSAAAAAATSLTAPTCGAPSLSPPRRRAWRARSPACPGRRAPAPSAPAAPGFRRSPREGRGRHRATGPHLSAVGPRPGRDRVDQQQRGLRQGSRGLACLVQGGLWGCCGTGSSAW